MLIKEITREAFEVPTRLACWIAIMLIPNGDLSFHSPSLLNFLETPDPFRTSSDLHDETPSSNAVGMLPLALPSARRAVTVYTHRSKGYFVHWRAVRHYLGRFT